MERLFVVGPPVSGDLFYGRREILSSIQFGNNYALVGVRRVGKTSITLELAKMFKKQGVAPVMLSLFEISPLTVENFLKKYTLAVTKAYLEDAGLVKKIGAFFTGQREGLLNFLKNIKVSVSIRDMVTLWAEYGEKKPTDYTEAIQKTIMYPEKLAKEAKKNFVVFIDEFQEIKDLGILNALRENMQKTPHVNYIVSGSAVGMMAQILGARKSPFYGFFIQKQIRGLDALSAVKLLARAKKRKIAISTEVAQKVIEKTKGYPLYLQTFGQVAVNTALLKGIKKIGEGEFEECWNKMFEEIYFHFEYLDGQLRGKKRAIAEAIALQNAESVSEISKATGMTLNELGSYINRLLREGILERNNSRYSFADPVFKEWLLQHKPRSL